MGLTSKSLALGVATLCVLAGSVLGLTVGLLEPTTGDLLALAGFLLLSGGITLGLGLAATRIRQPRLVHTLRGRLVVVSVLVTVLALANVGFVAVLMFLSTHDLALLAGLLVFSLGLSIFIAYALSEPTARTMREIVGSVRKISAGNLNTRVPVQSQDEVGELAAAFNDMLQRLEASLSRERSMQKARRELIGAVSHDLRTPLSSIRAMIESINDGVVTDEETIKRYLRATQSEVENLTQLIDNLFELSQIDAGVLKLNTHASFIEPIISSTLETMGAQAASCGLSLQGDVDQQLRPVKMDSVRIQRVLYNLVQNAIRHTPPDGSICIRALDVGKEVEVQIADTGEGISAKDLPRLFDRTFRADPSRSRSSGGAGLGLTIAKGIVEAHGGRIWAKSEVGRGSVFAFTLPKAARASKREMLTQ
jgi:two-component system sensor histidine kinase SaeS